MEIQAKLLNGNQSLEDIDMDVRTYNCMKNLSGFIDAGHSEISTWYRWTGPLSRDQKLLSINKLCSYHAQDLMKIPNFGRKSLRRLSAELWKHGFALGTPIPPEENCYYCGEETNHYAGNPSLWPLVFSHKENPGVAVSHHMKCVQMRLDEYEEMKANNG